jgi:hypothetical protein
MFSLADRHQIIFIVPGLLNCHPRAQLNLERVASGWLLLVQSSCHIL